MVEAKDSASHLGKRRRDLLDHDDESSHSRDPSKRATPDPAVQSLSAVSRQGSHSSLEMDEDLLEYADLAAELGINTKADMRQFLKQQEDVLASSQKEREARRQQEIADENFARQLEASWADEIPSQNFLEPRYTPNHTQDEPVAQVPTPTTEADNVRNTEQLPAHSDQRIDIAGGTCHMPGRFPSEPGTRQPSEMLEENGLGLLNGNDSQSDIEVIDSTLFIPNSRLQDFDRSSTFRPNAFIDTSTSIDLTTLGDQDNRAQNSLGRAEPVSSQYIGGPLALRSPTQFPPRDGFGDNFNHQQTLETHSNFSSYGSLDVPTFSRPTVQDPFMRTYMGWGGDSNGYNMQGINEFNEGAENSEALKNLLNNIKASEEDSLGAGSDERGGTPDGMIEAANLYKYQQRGLAWLVKMEEGTSKGSILADDMGLGKTIQAIALMLSRRSQNPSCKTNLIIAPVALISQWASEIKTKIKKSHSLSVLVYHGSNKSSVSWETIRDHDVVISTYGTLATDHRKRLELEKNLRENPNLQVKPTDKPVLTGDGCKFYRCILDEAQNIKNKNTKAAQAAHEVKSEYRLCMTGTPMMNDVVELFSLIHFLRIQPYCQWEKFHIDFARPLKSYYPTGRDRAMRRLQALCKGIMLRRMKKSMFDGKPLVVLPERSTDKVEACFDEDELAFYTALEAKTQLTFNKYLKAGTVGRNYSNVLTLLLRLRQACCHPHLLHDFAISVEITEEDLLENARSLSQAVIDRIMENGIIDCPVCMDTAMNYNIFNPCGHSACLECFCSLSDTATNPNAERIENATKAKFKCHACRGEVDPRCVTDYTSFKKLHQPEKNPDTAELTDDTSSESEADSDSDLDDSEDVHDSGQDSGSDSLQDFIVDDDSPLANGNADTSDNDLDESKPVKVLKLPQKAVKTEVDGKAPHQRSDGHRSSSDEPRSVIQSSRSEQAKATKADDNRENMKIGRTKSTSNTSLFSETEEYSDNDEPGYHRGSNPFEKASKRCEMLKKEKKNDDGQRKERKGKKMKGKNKKNTKTKEREGKGNKNRSKVSTHKTGPTRSLATLKKEGMRSIAAKREYFKRLSRDYVSSAKINQCIEILQTIVSAPEGEKVIVFSQFTSLLDLAEIPIERRGWKYRRFDGSMNAVQRNKSVEDFSNDKNTRILLVSLKAGNAGLNLTAASQVIILDPFWNPYIEEQAIDRAHRIGQRRNVRVHRILVPNTVEDRILKLQEKKREMIEGALDEGAGKSIGRLGVQELSYLFGVR